MKGTRDEVEVKSRRAEVKVKSRRAEVEEKQQLEVLDDLIEQLGDVLEDSEDDKTIYCEARRFIKSNTGKYNNNDYDSDISMRDIAANVLRN